MNFSIRFLLCTFFCLDLFAANILGNEPTPPKSEYSAESFQRLHVSDGDLETKAYQKTGDNNQQRQPSHSLGLNKREPAKTLPLNKIKNSSSASLSPKSRKNYYVLWPLNNKFIPQAPAILCPEDQANDEIVLEKLRLHSVDYIFFNQHAELDKIDIECKNKLFKIFEQAKTICAYIDNIEQCEEFISDIDPNKGEKSIFIFGLSQNRLNYELLAQLAIIGFIKDSKKKDELFLIDDKKISFADILLNKDYTLRITAILTRRALLKVFDNDEKKRISFFSVGEEGLLRAFCLKRLNLNHGLPEIVAIVNKDKATQALSECSEFDANMFIMPPSYGIGAMESPGMNYIGH